MVTGPGDVWQFHAGKRSKGRAQSSGLWASLEMTRSLRAVACRHLALQLKELSVLGHLDKHTSNPERTELLRQAWGR